MSKLGGYKIIDVSSAAIAASTATKAVIEGIYDAIESTRKPILLSGLHTADTEYPDAFIEPVVSSTDFVFTVFGLDITVTDNDEIYYTESD